MRSRANYYALFALRLLRYYSNDEQDIVTLFNIKQLCNTTKRECVHVKRPDVSHTVNTEQSSSCFVLFCCLCYVFTLCVIDFLSNNTLHFIYSLDLSILLIPLKSELEIRRNALELTNINGEVNEVFLVKEKREPTNHNLNFSFIKLPVPS